MTAKIYAWIFVCLLFLFAALNLTQKKVEAITSCGEIGAPVAGGLVTSPKITGQLNTSSGACIIDPKAAFVPYNIPTFDSLKSIYYDQAKTKPLITKHLPINGSATSSDIQLTVGNDHIYYIRDNLNVSYSITGTQNAIVFVGGDLNIGPLSSSSASSVTCNNNNNGVVFVVRGNVNIHQSVTGFNGLIIAEGKNGYSICTAYTGTECPITNILTQQLIINGSLISLNDSYPIKFRRNLGDNTQSAEKIIHEVKYLVILRDLLADTSLRWGEIDANEQIPDQAIQTTVPLPLPPSTETPNAFCDITTCHGEYAYTSPGSCTPNDAICNATYPINTCYPDSVDCTASCTLTPASCYTGSTCSKTGTCPNNFYPQTLSNCDTNGGCTSSCALQGQTISCGNPSTYYNGAQCNPPSNCGISSTKAAVCPHDPTKTPADIGYYTCYDTTDQYYHEQNTCSGSICPHNLPPPGSCPANTCHGEYLYASGLTCNELDAVCASNINTSYSNNQTTSCPVSGCETGAGNNQDTPQGGGVRATFTSGTVCSADDANCPLTNTSSRCTADGCSTSCNNIDCGTPLTYHDNVSCSAVGCTITDTKPTQCPTDPSTGAYLTCYTGDEKFYHTAGTCSSQACPRTFPTAGSCPTDTCHTAYTYSSGLTCGQDATCSSNTSTSYANNQATSCTADGCSSPAGGTQDLYTSGTVCANDDTNCPLADTKPSQCPTDGSGNYLTCYTGDERFYHTGSSCTAVSCTRTFPTPGSCPTDTCHGSYNYNSGLTCSTNDAYCASNIATYNRGQYANNQASSCTIDGCSSPAGGTQDKYTSGTVCSADDANCPLVNTQASQCPATCHTNEIFFHNSVSCTPQFCDQHYLNGGVSNQSSVCSANGGCSLANCTAQGCGTSLTYTPANSCLTNGSLASQATYAVGTGPNNLAMGDLNGDGKADLAVVNISSNNMSVLMNTGTGTFAAKVDYATGTGPYSIAMTDVNGDSKADLAVADNGINRVSVFINNGNGSFAPKVDYVTGQGPLSVAMGDLNGDGKADLALANISSNNVSVLMNNGTGTFATKVDYAVGATPFSVAMGDLNGDSKADLAVANYSNNNVSVLMNTGTGTFATKVDYAVGANPISVTVGDLNGDSKADLALANSSSNNVSVLMNNGTGIFAAKVDYATGPGPRVVTTGDLNGDGKTDLVVTNNSSNNVSVLMNNGTGIFAAKVDYVTGPNPANPWGIGMGELNGDGATDLAFVNYGNNTVSTLLNNGIGIGGACTITSTLNECPAACYVGDIYKHAAGTCAATKCNNNYPTTELNCVAGGCETSTNSNVADMDGGGVRDQYYPPQSCSKNGCNITSTELNICPTTCYDAPDQYYHPASTCSAAVCPHRYPNPDASSTDNILSQSQCDYCSGFTSYYSGSQCGPSSCPTNYPGNNVPTCHSSPGSYYSGNSCGLTSYPSNCTTFCGPNSIGCYSNSILIGAGGINGNEWDFENRYSNGNGRQTVYYPLQNLSVDCPEYGGNSSGYLLVSNINAAAASAGLNVDHSGINKYNNSDCLGRTPVYPNAHWGSGSVWSRATDNY